MVTQDQSLTFLVATKANLAKVIFWHRSERNEHSKRDIVNLIFNDLLLGADGSYTYVTGRHLPKSEQRSYEHIIQDGKSTLIERCNGQVTKKYRLDAPWLFIIEGRPLYLGTRVEFEYQENEITSYTVIGRALGRVQLGTTSEYVLFLYQTNRGMYGEYRPERIRNLRKMKECN